ncbi:hypothetical protein OSTOST_05984, partial [Ostertagia ostertagi]
MPLNMTEQMCLNVDVNGASNVPPPKQIDFSSQTIPELIYTRAKSDRVAAVFDAEKVSYTFAKVANGDARAGLLSTGLTPGDRILICGSNHSQGDFKAVICFRANEAQDYLYSLLKNICPEVTRSHKGQLKKCNLAEPHSCHLAEEDHRH